MSHAATQASCLSREYGRPMSQSDHSSREALRHTLSENLQREQFEGWWLESQKRLLARATWLTGSPDRGLDLVQDLAVLALRQFDRRPFSTAEEFSRWAYLRLRWMALDRLRLNQRRGSESLSARVQDPPTSREVSAILLSALKRGLRDLPTRQKTVLKRVWAGRTTREIAADLGITEATVRSSLRHARLRLAGHLPSSEVDEGKGG